ncbi:MAG: hypothetical protein ABW168_28910 [Sedimenticola sp.]
MNHEINEANPVLHGRSWLDDLVQGAQRSTMKELGECTLATDKVLVF